MLARPLKCSLYTSSKVLSTLCTGAVVGAVVGLLAGLWATIYHCLTSMGLERWLKLVFFWLIWHTLFMEQRFYNSVY